MHKWIYMAVLAALMLNIALALPVNLDDVVDTGETDEQLLQLLSGHSMEDDEAVSLEHRRLRRMPIEDPDKVGTDCGGHMHPDELAHEHLGHKHAGRERRAAGKDSSASSEEVGQDQKGQEQAQDKANSSSEEKPKVRRRRGADSSASSEEVGKDEKGPEEQQQQQHDKSDSSSEEKPPARKRRSAGEDLNTSSEEKGQEQHPAQPAQEEKNVSEQLDVDAIDSASTYLTMEDYAQGCEVLEVNSNEVNNETTYVE